MKTLIFLGNYASYTLCHAELPGWLACAGLLVLVIESIRWADNC